MKIEALEPGNYYHIYNRGNNKGPVFFEEANYKYFLKLLDKYISPVADTYAWCLMKNHYHLLVYLKEINQIEYSDLTYSTKEKPNKINASSQFSHFFNSYTQAINKKYNKSGSLFEKPFKRIRVDSEEYFRKLILYTHRNPMTHRVVKDFVQYPWSSYKTILSVKPTKLKRKEVIGYFDTIDNFITCHRKELDIEDFF